MNFAIADDESLVVNLDTVQSIDNLIGDNRYDIKFTDGSQFKGVSRSVIHSLVKDINYMRNLSVAEAKVNVCKQSSGVLDQLKNDYKTYEADSSSDAFKRGFREGLKYCAKELGVDVNDWDDAIYANTTW